MSAFTSLEDRETITHEDEDGKSFITFQTEVDMGMEQRVAQYISTRGGGYASNATIKLALYRYAVVDWGGPLFTLNGDPVPCLPDFVEKVRAKNPLMLQARARMDEIFFTEEKAEADAAAAPDSETPSAAAAPEADDPNAVGHPTV